MAIEQFVKHIENLHDQNNKFTEGKQELVKKGPIKSVSHLNDDLIKLKDMLKEVMDYKTANK